MAHTQNKAPDMTAIASISSTIYESATRIRRRLIKFERTGIDERKRSGPKYLKSQNEDAVINTIRLFDETNPGTDQKAICDKLEERFGLRYSQSTVSMLMKIKRIPHKRTNKFYKKAKLVSTHPDGEIMPLPERVADRRLLAEGVMLSAPYVSPYAQFVVATCSSGEVPPAIQ